MTYLGQNEITVYYSNLALVVAEGNFVFTAAEAVFGETPTAYFDLFRAGVRCAWCAP